MHSPEPMRACPPTSPLTGRLAAVVASAAVPAGDGDENRRREDLIRVHARRCTRGVRVGASPWDDHAMRASRDAQNGEPPIVPRLARRAVYDLADGPELLHLRHPGGDVGDAVLVRGGGHELRGAGGIEGVAIEAAAIEPAQARDRRIVAE